MTKTNVKLFDITKNSPLFNGLYLIDLSGTITNYRINLERLRRLLYLLSLRTTKIHITGLADLCLKLNLIYNSDEVLHILFRVISICNDLGIQVYEYKEGLAPTDNLYYLTDSTLFIHRQLMNKFTILGYCTSQMTEVYDIDNNLYKFLPEDLLDELPLNNKQNKNQYYKIKELLNDKRLCYI